MTVTREEMLEVLAVAHKHATSFNLAYSDDALGYIQVGYLRKLAALYTRLQSEAARPNAAEELAEAWAKQNYPGLVKAFRKEYPDYIKEPYSSWFGLHSDKPILLDDIADIVLSALATYRTANQEREVMPTDPGHGMESSSTDATRPRPPEPEGGAKGNAGGYVKDATPNASRPSPSAPHDVREIAEQDAELVRLLRVGAHGYGHHLALLERAANRIAALSTAHRQGREAERAAGKAAGWNDAMAAASFANAISTADHIKPQEARDD